MLREKCHSQSDKLCCCSRLFAQAAAEAWAAAFPTKEKQRAAASAVSTELLAGLCDAACITPAAAVERGMCEQSVADELAERSTSSCGTRRSIRARLSLRRCSLRHRRARHVVCRG